MPSSYKSKYATLSRWSSGGSTRWRRQSVEGEPGGARLRLLIERQWQHCERRELRLPPICISGLLRKVLSMATWTKPKRKRRQPTSAGKNPRKPYAFRRGSEGAISLWRQSPRAQGHHSRAGSPSPHRELVGQDVPG